MARQSFSYTHADTGTAPSSSLNFEKNERPKAGHFDWYWYNVTEAISGHASEFGRLDGNDDGIVDESDTLTAGGNLKGDLQAVDGEVIWDESATHIPQDRLANDAVTVTAGDGLKGGGGVALGNSITINIEPADFAGSHLSDDGSDNLQVNDDFLLNTGDSISGNLDFSGNAAESLGYAEFQNVETVNDGRLGMDDSMGFIGHWGANGMAVLWDSYNVSAGTDININGGKGDESLPTISHANTSGQGNVSANGATVIDDIDLDGNGHLTNINTENRTIDDWQNSGDATSNSVDADTVDGEHSSAFADSGHTHSLGDLSDVTATGEGSGNGFDADTVDGSHASELGRTEDEIGNIARAYSAVLSRNSAGL